MTKEIKMENKKTNLLEHLDRYRSNLVSAIGHSAQANLSGVDKSLDSAKKAAETLGDMVMFLRLLDKAEPEERTVHVRCTVIPATRKGVLAAHNAMREIEAAARDSFSRAKNEAVKAIYNVAETLEQTEALVQQRIHDELDQACAVEKSPTKIIHGSLIDAINFLACLETRTERRMARKQKQELSKEQKQRLHRFCQQLAPVYKALDEANSWIQIGETKAEAPAYVMGSISAYHGAKGLVDRFWAQTHSERSQIIARLKNAPPAYRQSPQGAYNAAILALMVTTKAHFNRMDRKIARAAGTLRQENPTRAPGLAFAL